jgi:predicted transcriptional regulator
MASQDTTDMMIELLGKGYRQVEVARLMDVTESAVAQLAERHRAKIQELRIESTVATRAIDQDVDEAEQLALDRLMKQLAFETDTNKLTRAYSVLNAAKRRTLPMDDASAGASQVAQVRLPSHLQQNITFVSNTHNQIVQINDKSLSTASNKQVDGLLERHRQRALRGGQDELSAKDFEKEVGNS